MNPVSSVSFVCLIILLLCFYPYIVCLNKKNYRICSILAISMIFLYCISMLVKVFAFGCNFYSTTILMDIITTIIWCFTSSTVLKMWKNENKL